MFYSVFFRVKYFTINFVPFLIASDWPTSHIVATLCFGDVSDREIRGSSPPSTAVPGPIKGELHSSQLHTECILLYACPVLGQSKSDPISYLFLTKFL